MFVEINARSYCLRFLLNLQIHKKSHGTKMKLKENRRKLMNYNWNRFRKLFSSSCDELNDFGGRVVSTNSIINKHFAHLVRQIYLTSYLCTLNTFSFEDIRNVILFLIAFS